MVKLFKCKETVKDYGVSVLVGTAVLLVMLGVATSVHHILMMLGIAALLGITIYSLWRIL